MTVRIAQPTADDCDIVVNIHRLFHCGFEGTSEQLRAEGLLPNDLVLPTGRKEAHWISGDWSYKLVRVRAPGSTELFAVWGKVDWWRLSRWWLKTGALSISDRHVLEQREACARKIWDLSQAGQRQAALYQRARSDETLQAMIRALTGKRGVSR